MDVPSNQHPRVVFFLFFFVSGNGRASPILTFSVLHSKKNAKIRDGFHLARPVASSFGNTLQRRHCRKSINNWLCTKRMSKQWSGLDGEKPPTPPTPSSQHFPAGAAVPATAAQFSTAIFEAAYRRAAKFPCLCQSLERRGEYCSPSHKSSCAHKGKYLCWAAAWQSLACLFFSAVFFFLLLFSLSSCFHNPSSPCLSSKPAPALPLTPFSCTFSVSPTPNSYKTLDSQQFL